MEPSKFPLRWESIGDKWWYASPIDYACANGHYDLVRQLLHLDSNHLISLTSLRRIRRLEAVWDDEDDNKLFNTIAKSRCHVAQQLYVECNNNSSGTHNKANSLIEGGYGGWVLYSALSAGDLEFVQEVLEKYPLLVFGEGEYGVSDMFYGAAKSENVEVFRVVYDHAVSARVSRNGDVEVEENGGVSLGFMMEVKNRGVHGAARGGCLVVLKELLDGCNNVLEFRDVNSCTVLHSAAAKGQVEVVRHLIASYDLISSVDGEGNTPLHIAAYKGQLCALEALIQASPSSASMVNNDGNTFLHMAVSGFQTPGFRRLDQQIELVKQLVSCKSFIIEDIINFKNKEGQTALHLAIIGNIHSDLVQLLMSARYIDVNIRDDHGMTPLDYLKRHPKSASSEILIRELISAGGISSCKDYAVRKAFASHLKMQGICSSPGTSFRVSDNEIFLDTSIDCLLQSSSGKRSGEHFHFQLSNEASHCGSPTEVDNRTLDIKKSGPLHSVTKRLKLMFHLPLVKRKETEKSERMREKDEIFSDKRWSTSEETPISLRQRYSNASLSSNKRTLAVRSNISSPANRKKLAAGGVLYDGLKEQLFVNHSAQHTRSKSSLSSSISLEIGKEIYVEDENARPSCSKHINCGDDAPKVTQKQGSRLNPILCFGGSYLSVKNSAGKHCTKQPIHSVA